MSLPIVNVMQDGRDFYTFNKEGEVDAIFSWGETVTDYDINKAMQARKWFEQNFANRKFIPNYI